MSITNHERVGKALELLRQGLAPFVEREIKEALKSGAITMERLQSFSEEEKLADRHISQWDAAGLLKLMWETWNECFKHTLGFSERSLVSELRDWRNRWAHQHTFSSDDTYRAIDSAARLLRAVSAPHAEDLERMKLELLRLRFDEQVRNEKRKAGGSLIEAAATGGLKPWREVITPHPDVAAGRFQQAEFAADLWQVYLGEGNDEYRDPVEFFRRTYLTESLKWLLVNALKRLSGMGGEPVVQLQTSFGGGKTHSMLALYHLFSGTPPSDLPGIEEVMKAAGVSSVPKVKRVVLVGNRISPGNPSVKPDGTRICTLWGEIAWQLGGREAFERVRSDDERATNPGDVMRQLLKEHGPCLILIDEWVAYARQLHDLGDLPAGSFETQFTFAQNLTESAKLADRALLVVSLPASDASGADDTEVGGIRGREALERLRKVIGRIESPWRPATAEESFEIVRRRLFQPFTDPDQFKQRDVIARAFADLYRSQRDEFPSECAEADYERRIRAAYPIHPELFDRLYSDWSSLANFQRTRGVLRLMAAVIHCLWRDGDRNPLILPASVPIDDDRVRFELTRYLPDNWMPIIEKDVDGPDSLPRRLDSENPNLGKLHATRRVARTVYLGSAPMAAAAHRGIEDRRIKLGCVMPGEPPAIFGDALRRLAATATYLYQDGSRYWYSTQPTVTKLAEDRAEMLKRDRDSVIQELEQRLRSEVRRSEIRVHMLPRSSSDIPDDLDARLVVLPPDLPYTRDADNPAMKAAGEILERRGSAPRMYRNTLVFLAADSMRLSDLEDALRRYLAWRSILDEREELNLDPHQTRQARAQMEDAERAVAARVPETYQWLLVPEQSSPSAPVEWKQFRLTGSEDIITRAIRKLKHEGMLTEKLAPAVLRRYLDEIPLWRGDHVSVRQLVEDFSSYIYLPRLRSPEVLAEAVAEGISLISWETETFALADGYENGRYQGLRYCQAVRITPESSCILVRNEAAIRQITGDAQAAAASASSSIGASAYEAGRTVVRTRGDVPTETQTIKKPPRRFYAAVDLDPERVGRDAARIAEEVIVHLLNGSDVQVTLEIQARSAEGFPENVVRIVSENSRALQFRNHGFEPE
ncbi:MAG: Swt1 family HEPN domain-containing protein [Methanothrix sp.]|uniref:Swt1 family HEPN domain-containing protein n=1 Tax=Methanothrix sp. TaxID=90426 RepID=UPI0032AF5692|nr:Swt1 family HEPN domain-containing protein [Methanothrix sp.]